MAFFRLGPKFFSLLPVCIVSLELPDQCKRLYTFNRIGDNTRPAHEMGVLNSSAGNEGADEPSQTRSFSPEPSLLLYIKYGSR